MNGGTATATVLVRDAALPLCRNLPSPRRDRVEIFLISVNRASEANKHKKGMRKEKEKSYL